MTLLASRATHHQRRIGTRRIARRADHAITHADGREIKGAKITAHGQRERLNAHRSSSSMTASTSRSRAML
jgi:hypothetical protein